MRHPENMQNLCLCGHERWKHYNKHKSLGYCHACSWRGGGSYTPGSKYKHEFQLDNLDYVERVAKERNLI
jgi:hypothetical protein